MSRGVAFKAEFVLPSSWKKIIVANFDVKNFKGGWMMLGKLFKPPSLHQKSMIITMMK